MDDSLIKETLNILSFAAGPLLRPRQPCEASDAGSAGRKSIGNAADSFLLEVSKVAVMCGGGSLTPEEAASLLQAVQQRFTALCAALHSVLVCREAGPSLREAVSAAADGLLDASSALVNSLTDQDAWAALPQRVGVISQRCTAAKHLPLDNKVAIGRKFIQNLKQVKDVLREVTELTASQAEVETSISGQANSGQEGSGAPGSSTSCVQPSSGSVPVEAAAHSGADNLHSEVAERLALGHDQAHQPANGSDRGAQAAQNNHRRRADDCRQAAVPDEDATEEQSWREALSNFEAEELSPLERDVAVATEQVVVHVVSLLELAVRKLLRGAVPLGAALECWESLAFHCKALEEATNDLGTELYGPQDGRAVSSAADAVATCTELIVDELLEDGGLTQSSAEDRADLLGSLRAAHDALAQRVDLLVRAQGGGGADLSSEE